VTILCGTILFYNFSGRTFQALKMGMSEPQFFIPEKAAFVEFGLVFGLPLNTGDERFHEIKIGMYYKKEITVFKYEIFMPFISFEVYP
jgi:hypothetical protein